MRSVRPWLAAEARVAPVDDRSILFVIEEATKPSALRATERTLYMSPSSTRGGTLPSRSQTQMCLPFHPVAARFPSALRARALTGFLSPSRTRRAFLSRPDRDCWCSVSWGARTTFGANPGSTFALPETVELDPLDAELVALRGEELTVLPAVCKPP